jgi:hypothetical protein
VLEQSTWSAAANALRGHGHGVDEGLLPVPVAAGLPHINLTGDYLGVSSKVPLGPPPRVLAYDF